MIAVTAVPAKLPVRTDAPTSATRPALAAARLIGEPIRVPGGKDVVTVPVVSVILKVDSESPTAL